MLTGETFQVSADGVCIVDAPEDLIAFQHSDCAGAIWKRRTEPSFQTWIDALDPNRLPEARVILRPEDVRSAVSQICEMAGTPDCPEREMLVDDTAALAHIFLEVMPAPYLRLRFDVLTTNACRKFHIDTIRARLICTYRGTGTQYGTSIAGADPETIYTVPTGEPILLRGKLWPESPDAGLRHRSPPIEGTGETRLVLVLDPIFDPEEEI